MARRRRSRGTWLAVAGIVAAALALGAWFGRQALGDGATWVGDRAGEAADTWEDWATQLRTVAAGVPDLELDARTAEVESIGVLIAVGEGPGSAAFALVSMNPEGVPAVTLLPQRLLGVVPGFGEFGLDDAMLFEGADLAGVTVTNLLGIRIDHLLALPAGSLAAMLPASVAVDVPVPLFIREAGGTTRLVDQGLQQMSGEMVEVLLATAGAGDPFEWLQRQGAAWRAVLAEIAVDPSLADRLAGSSPAEVADLLVAVAVADDLLFASLPVERTGTGDEGSFVVSTGAAKTFVTERFGHLLIREGERPRVEILNGNGRIGTTMVVAETLVRRGFRVVLTDNADRFDYAETLVIAQGRDAEPAAREAAGALGAGTVFLESRAPSTVVDVSIIVGQDIPSGED